MALGMSFLVLMRYKGQAGEIGKPAEFWPAESRLMRARHQSNLVLVLHPHCPCSTASLAELARIMAAAGARLAGHVVFVRPGGTSPGWGRTGLWRDARALPGVTVLEDPDGAEANRFGARTSGQAVLYDQSGRLRFRGGITPARGHEGPSAGRDAVLAVLDKDAPRVVRCDVYGCPLFAQSAREDGR